MLLYVSSYCYVCPHTAMCVSAYCSMAIILELLYVYYYISVLKLLHMCPHTAIYVSSGLNRKSRYARSYACAAIYVSSYCYIRVLRAKPQQSSRQILRICSYTHVRPLSFYSPPTGGELGEACASRVASSESVSPSSPDEPRRAKIPKCVSSDAFAAAGMLTYADVC